MTELECVCYDAQDSQQMLFVILGMMVLVLVYVMGPDWRYRWREWRKKRK